MALIDPQDWLSVPSGIGSELPLTDEILRHLKWMMEKDALGQDMFLIGYVCRLCQVALSATQSSGADPKMARLPVLCAHAARGRVRTPLHADCLAFIVRNALCLRLDLSGSLVL